MARERHVSTTGAWRLVRGAAVGTCASGLGALAHVSGGGDIPPSSLLVGLAVFATGVCVLVSRWRWTLPSLVGVLMLAQIGFHQFFARFGGPDVHHGAGGSTPHYGLLHPEPPASLAVDMSDRMLLQHTVAALTLAVLLRFGDQWLRRVVDVLGLRISRLLDAAWQLPSTGRYVPATAVSGVVPRAYLEHSVWSRGPPQ